MKTKIVIPVLIFISIAIFIFFSILLMNNAVTNSEKHWNELDKKTYIAWCKLNEKEISFEEWKLLRQSGLLQGQKP